MKKLFLPLIIFLFLLVSCQEYSLSGDESYESVVIIGVDGAGCYFESPKISNFSNLFEENSAIGYHCTAQTPTGSAQNWASFLHGVSPLKHKCVNGSISCERFPYSKYPSIFKIVREVYPDCEMDSFCEWNSVNYGLIETSAKVNKSSDLRFCTSVHNTAQIEEMTLKCLKEGKSKLLFVHLINVDEAGHANKYGSDKYLAELQKEVDFINEVDKLIDYSKTLLIVVTDHGGIEKNHGGSSDQEIDITIAIKGKTVNQMTLDSTVMPKDIPAIVLKALGINIPSFMEGKIPLGLVI